MRTRAILSCAHFSPYSCVNVILMPLMLTIIFKKLKCIQHRRRRHRQLRRHYNITLKVA